MDIVQKVLNEGGMLKEEKIRQVPHEKEKSGKKKNQLKAGESEENAQRSPGSRKMYEEGDENPSPSLTR
jgi:hypothetical protein